MSGEIWQFLLVGATGQMIASLWLFVIYLPRRTAKGEGAYATRITEGPADRD